MSPSKTALLHASPSAAVAGTADVGRTATCVKPATGVVIGVLIKETVGREAAPNVGEATAEVSRVGNDASVDADVCVTTGTGVFVGMDNAVCVNCTESWATVVPTSAVLSALISWVGAGAAPTLQAVISRAAVSKLINACRVVFFENIIVTSISERVKCADSISIDDMYPSSLYCNVVCDALDVRAWQSP